jgi:hypothetical protein
VALYAMDVYHWSVTHPTRCLGPTAEHGAFVLDVPAVGRVTSNLAVRGSERASVPFALRVTPNPFFEAAEVRFATPAHAFPPKLKIFDASGRKVRTLSGGALPAREGRVLWDGRDEHGARVAAGVYFFRIDAGDETMARLAVRLR